MYPELFSIGPVTVYTYGVLLAASSLLGLQFAIARARKWRLDANRVLDLGIYIIIAALIGAKLLLVVTDFNQFRASPADLLSIARSAGVFYGGLITAIAGANASQVVQNGMRWRCMYQKATAIAEMRPP